MRLFFLGDVASVQADWKHKENTCDDMSYIPEERAC